MASTHFDNIPFDVLTYIFEFLHDRQTLLACALVSHTLHEAVKPRLFYCIELRHMSETNDFRTLQQLERYPYLRTYIRKVRHHAPQNESGQSFSETSAIPAWAISIGKLENLTSYTLCSTFRATISAEFLQIVVHVLVKCKNLRDIRLDFNVYSYHVPVIRLLGNLSAITFGRASRAVLTQIGPWIEEFTQPLENLSIIDGTKVELGTIVPLTSTFSFLRRFSLGRGHKLSRTDLLRVVADMPYVEYLDIFYDNFVNDIGNPSPTLTAVTQLKELIVRHQGVSRMRQFITFTNWLTILVMPSRLTSLTIISDDGKQCTNSNDFIASLPRIQSMGLRILKVSGFVFNGQDLRTVLSWKHLEVLEFRLEDISALDTCIKLPTASIRLPNATAKLVALRWITALQERVVMGKVKSLMTALGREQGSMRKIASSKLTSEWEGLWSMPGKEELVMGE